MLLLLCNHPPLLTGVLLSRYIEELSSITLVKVREGQGEGVSGEILGGP